MTIFLGLTLLQNEYLIQVQNTLFNLPFLKVGKCLVSERVESVMYLLVFWQKMFKNNVL